MLGLDHQSFLIINIIFHGVSIEWILKIVCSYLAKSQLEFDFSNPFFFLILDLNTRVLLVDM